MDDIRIAEFNLRLVRHQTGPAIPAWLRNASFWGAICLITAVPNYLSARSIYDLSFDEAGLWTGISLVTLFYVSIGNIPSIAHWCAQLPVNRAVWFALWTRVVLLLVFPLGMLVDYPSASWSFRLIEQHMPASFTSHGAGSFVLFGGTLAMTLLQAMFLSAVMISFVALLWAFQTNLTNRARRTQHAFPVQPPKEQP